MLDIEKNKIIENIRTTMAVEGHSLGQDDVSLINQYLSNEITVEQGLEIIKRDIISKMGDKQ